MISAAIREQIDIPILMVTAKRRSMDKIRGLGLGADDYIVKPFDPMELVARVKSHLLRYERLTGKNGTTQEGKEYDADDYCIEVGGLKILTKSWKVIRGGEEIHFPNREFELLKYLAMNPNIVFSKEHLFERIWGYDYMSDSATVTVHINRIREDRGRSKESKDYRDGVGRRVSPEYQIRNQKPVRDGRNAYL